MEAGAAAKGPDLPGGAMNGFGPATTVVGRSLYVSVDDGGLYRLNDGASTWSKVGQATPRIVHRLVGRSLIATVQARRRDQKF